MYSLKTYGSRTNAILVSTLFVIFFSGCATQEVVKKPEVDITAMKMVQFEDTPAGLLVTMKDAVLFKSGSSDFSTAASPIFDVLVPEFRRARGSILVTGHTDSTGSSSLNMKLSQQRAEKVRAELISRQLPPDRIVAKGKGFTEPLVHPEKSEGDRQANRRATFLLPGETIASMNGEKVVEKVDGLSQVKSLMAETAARASEFYESFKSLIKGQLDNK